MLGSPSRLAGGAGEKGVSVQSHPSGRARAHGLEITQEVSQVFLAVEGTLAVQRRLPFAGCALESGLGRSDEAAVLQICSFRAAATTGCSKFIKPASPPLSGR